MSSLSDMPSHRPNRQQVAAAATRNEILLAARALFSERGYAQTSIQAIADRAGVSVPTIYASVGAKAAVANALVELVDFRIGGDEARDRLATEPDPRALIATGARINRLLHENFGDLVRAIRNAGLVEPEVAPVAEAGRQLGVAGATHMAQRLAELGALSNGVSKQEAIDVIRLLTDHDCYEFLVGGCGWSHDRAEAWIRETLVDRLLGPRA